MSTTVSSLLFPLYPSLPIMPPSPSLSPLFSSPKTLAKPYLSLSRSKTHNLLLSPRAVADHSDTASIAVDNDLAADSTAFIVRARNRIGLLQVITNVFNVLGLRIDRASVEIDGEFFIKKFFVVDPKGGKIEKINNPAQQPGVHSGATGGETPADFTADEIRVNVLGGPVDATGGGTDIDPLWSPPSTVHLRL